MDVTSRVIVHKLAHQQHGWQVTEVIMDHHVGAAVQQALTNFGSEYLLISTAKVDTLWFLSLDGNNNIATNTWDDRGQFRWGTNPSNNDHLIFISNDAVHLYHRQTLEKLTAPEGILLGEVFFQSLLFDPLPHASMTPSLQLYSQSHQDLNQGLSCYSGRPQISALSRRLQYQYQSIRVWPTK